MPAFLVTAMSVPAQPAHPYRERRREEEEREEERLSELGVIERLKDGTDPAAVYCSFPPMILMRPMIPHLRDALLVSLCSASKAES